MRGSVHDRTQIKLLIPAILVSEKLLYRGMLRENWAATSVER